MATAKQIRTVILRCAADAMFAEPSNIDARARRFVAFLSGSFQFLEDRAVEAALDQILELDKPKQPPADGA